MNRLLTCTLGIALLATAFFALSLTTVHGDITITFGHQPAPDAKTAVLAMVMPVSALRSR